MKPQWYKVYASPNIAEANIVKGMLEENEIPVIILNKQDSSYLNFGELELYVHPMFKELAVQLVEKALLN